MSVKRLFHLLLITCLTVSVTFMAGCAPEEQAEDEQDNNDLREYEVDIQFDPEDAGEIEGEGTYEEGEKVKIQVDIEEGYKFKGWYEDEERVSRHEEYEFEIEDDKKLVAELEEVVNIPDENLEAAIKKELRVEQVTKENIKELTSLEAEEDGVRDLNNLGKAKNLKRLNLSGNEIQDISALTELTALEKLDLSNNEITDIKALHELTNLKEINLAGNEVDEISFLGELSDLEILSLSVDHNMKTTKVTLVDFDQSPGGDYIAYRVKCELPLTRDVQVVNINENVSIEQVIEQVFEWVFEPNGVTDGCEFYSFAETSNYETPFAQHIPRACPSDVYKDHEWKNSEVLKVVVREGLEEGKDGEHKLSGEYKFDFKNREIIKTNN